VCPTLETAEDVERYEHRDLDRLDRWDAWAEYQRLKWRLANLIARRERGRLLTVNGAGELVYELHWIGDRLNRLDRWRLRGGASRR
jgi:hypothetical protein